LFTTSAFTGNGSAVYGSAGGGGGSGSGAPYTATYVCLSTDALLSSERVLTAGSNIELIDTGAGGIIRINSSFPSVVIGTSAAPYTATYVCLSTNTILTNERVLTAGSNIEFVDVGGTLRVNASFAGGGGGSGLWGNMPSWIYPYNQSGLQIYNNQGIRFGNNSGLLPVSYGTYPTQLTNYHMGGWGSGIGTAWLNISTDTSNYADYHNWCNIAADIIVDPGQSVVPNLNFPYHPQFAGQRMRVYNKGYITPNQSSHSDIAVLDAWMFQTGDYDGTVIEAQGWHVGTGSLTAAEIYAMDGTPGDANYSTSFPAKLIFAVHSIVGPTKKNYGDYDVSGSCANFTAMQNGTKLATAVLKVIATGAPGYLFGIDLMRGIYTEAAVRMALTQSISFRNTADTSNLKAVKGITGDYLSIGDDFQRTYLASPVRCSSTLALGNAKPLYMSNYSGADQNVLYMSTSNVLVLGNDVTSGNLFMQIAGAQRRIGVNASGYLYVF
jgi:hypothetical protein